LQKPKAGAPGNFKLGAGEHFGIFIQDGLRNIETSRPSKRNHEGGSWNALLLKRR
jgi:hypothetical protein